jgi:hypothetical protein
MTAHVPIGTWSQYAYQRSQNVHRSYQYATAPVLFVAMTPPSMYPDIHTIICVSQLDDGERINNYGTTAGLSAAQT